VCVFSVWVVFAAPGASLSFTAFPDSAVLPAGCPHNPGRPGKLCWGHRCHEPADDAEDRLIPTTQRDQLSS
jgi:hypothetical protein